MDYVVICGNFLQKKLGFAEITEMIHRHDDSGKDDNCRNGLSVMPDPSTALHFRCQPFWVGCHSAENGRDFHVFLVLTVYDNAEVFQWG